jgi:hypothetical protein
MKKEEFPTFLNEHATVIFGRTTRELLWIVCGLVCGYQTWSTVTSAQSGTAGMVVGIVLGILVCLCFCVIALLPIGSRSLEEWIMVWGMFMFMPKLYLYRPAEQEVDYERLEREREQTTQQKTGKKVVDLDILEE